MPVLLVEHLPHARTRAGVSIHCAPGSVMAAADKKYLNLLLSKHKKRLESGWDSRRRPVVLSKPSRMIWVMLQHLEPWPG